MATRQPLGVVPSLLRQTAAWPSSVWLHQLVPPQMGQGWCLEASRQPVLAPFSRGPRMGTALVLPRLDCRSTLVGAAKVAAAGSGECM